MPEPDQQTYYHLDNLHPDHQRLLRDLAGGQARLERVMLALTRGERIVRAEIAQVVATLQPLLDAAKTIEADLAAQMATINDLNAKLAAGQALAPDDVAALADAVAKVQQATSGLTTAAQAVAPAAQAATAAAAASQQPSANPAPTTGTAQPGA